MGLLWLACKGYAGDSQVQGDNFGSLLALPGTSRQLCFVGHANFVLPASDRQ